MSLAAVADHTMLVPLDVVVGTRRTLKSRVGSQTKPAVALVDSSASRIGLARETSPETLRIRIAEFRVSTW
jgi:hypothetical protein